MVLKTAKAMALVRGGEIAVGTDLAIECASECRKYGMIRLLERLYGINKYLLHLKNRIGKSEDRLREVLDGPTDF